MYIKFNEIETQAIRTFIGSANSFRKLLGLEEKVVDLKIEKEHVIVSDEADKTLTVVVSVELTTAFLQLCTKWAELYAEVLNIGLSLYRIFTVRFGELQGDAESIAKMLMKDHWC